MSDPPECQGKIKNIFWRKIKESHQPPVWVLSEDAGILEDLSSTGDAWLF